MKKFLLVLIAAQIFLSSAEATPNIIYKPVEWTDYREELTREYARMHYDMDITTIEPRAVVVHWTAGDTFESAFKTFYNETLGYDDEGLVNVSSQFIVDRDGTIYSLMPETKLARHAIGYNWCAIGIENVGGVGGVEDLTSAQFQANVELIRYLHEKYPTIEYVVGHYQQVEARASGLFIEHVPDYFAGKPDPGKIFMRALREELEGDGLKFFKE